jgi:hypothetical protein
MPIAGPTSRPNNVRNLEAGMLLIGAGAILLFVSLFFEWFQRGLDAFEIFEVWDLVLAVLAIGALTAVASSFGFGPARPASWLVGPAAAALVIVLFTLINPPPVAAGIDDDPSTGLWLALAASVLMVAGAVMSVARISVAFAPAHHGVADPLAPRHDGVAQPGTIHPVDPRRGAVGDPRGDAVADPRPGAVGGPAVGDAPGPLGRRFMRGAGPGPADPVDPAPPPPAPPTEPTRRI